MPENTNAEDHLFEAALLRSIGPERTAFLDDECRGAPELRARVEMMLEGHLNAKNFLEPLPDKVSPESASPETAASEQLGSYIGPYKLLQKLGEGGCGIVYLAEQHQPVRRRVALKVIKLGMDTRSVIARFEAERQALALMDHPNIAKVFDAGATDTGRPYFVMEAVRGIRISEYCDQNNLSTGQRLSLFIQVCHAIQHAHQKGIIHRDIKPSNILITLHDGVPVPKVIDFGIAKATYEQLLTTKTIFTAFEQFIGTPAYMSPEQAEMSGLDIDTRSDIYSLGVLLYELLTGSTPFDAKELLASGLDAMRKTIREKEAVRPSTKVATLEGAELETTAQRRSAEPSKLLHQLKGDLDWIIMKCLEKDRARRYETANGLAADLNRHLSNEPVVARPPSTAYRMHKTFRRNKLAFAAAAAVAASLVIGGAVSVWQGAGAKRARKAEQIHRLAAEAATKEAIFNAQSAEGQKIIAEENARKAADALRLGERRELETHRMAYAAHMNLAHQAVKNNNLGRAMELLNLYRPKAGNPELRGWEWRYLWALCRTDSEFELCRLLGPDPVLSSALSADGKLAAFGAYSGTGVVVWDLSQRREVARLAPGEEFCHVAFSPNGHLLAFSSMTSLRVWDCVERKLLTNVAVADRIVTLGFSGDGKQLVTFGQTNITIWNPPDLSELRVLTHVKSDAWLGTPFAFSADLKVVVYYEGYNAIVAMELETGKERWRGECQDGSATLAISPDGAVLAVGLPRGPINVLEMASGKQLTSLTGHGAWISTLVFWPDGKKLASASADQTVRLWDMETFKPQAVLRGHKLEVWSMALSRDSERLITGSKDGSVLVWNPATDAAQRNHWQIACGAFVTWVFCRDGSGIMGVDGESGRVVKLTGKKYSNIETIMELGRDAGGLKKGGYRFAPSGRFLARLSDAGVLQVWDLEERRAVQQFPTGLKEGQTAGFSRDETKIWLWSTPSAGILSEWDLSKRQLLRSIPDVSWPTRFAPDQWLFYQSTNGVGFHDLHSGTDYNPVMFPRPLSSLDGSPGASPDGSLLAVPHDAGHLTVWETRHLFSSDHHQPLRTLGGILLSFSTAGFSPDGTRLLGCAEGQETIRIWDTSSWHELLTLSADDSISRWQSGFSRDERDLVLGTWALVVWRAASWAEISEAEKLEAALALSN